MTAPTLPPPWEAAQAALQARDQEVADWYVWAAMRRLQQAGRDLDIHRRELNTFQDSFMLQLAQLQQYDQRHQDQENQLAWPDDPGREALVARIRTMHLLGHMLEEASRTLHYQATMLGQMAAAARAAAPVQGDPTDN